MDDVRVSPQRLLSLFAAKDLELFIDSAFRLLQSAVVCDFSSAFYRGGKNGLLKGRDSLGREYDGAFMRRHVELNPAVQLVLVNRGIRVLTTRTGLPQSSEQLRKMPFYREIMQPLGWRHSVALCFWGDPPEEFPVFVASVERREQRSDFSKQDVARLEGLHPFLNSAVNRRYELEAATTVHDGMAMVGDDGKHGFAILDRHLRLIRANRAAYQLCGLWMTHGELSHPGEGSWRLPPALENICEELHHEWQTVLRADPDATGLRFHRSVVHDCLPGLTASITMVCPSTTGLAQPAFVVEFDRRMPGMALEALDRSVPLLQSLTAAERRVAMVLADGCSNQEIAERLGKSIHAVKFLLHKIYGKTGLPSRAALVAVLRSQSKSRKHVF
jgi:DNA-binding CsgD family transcriptional regulator